VSKGGPKSGQRRKHRRTQPKGAARPLPPTEERSAIIAATRAHPSPRARMAANGLFKGRGPIVGPTSSVEAWLAWIHEAPKRRRRAA
jgi:hypothetical protein